MSQVGDEELAGLNLIENSIRYRLGMFNLVGCDRLSSENAEHLFDAILDVFKFGFVLSNRHHDEGCVRPVARSARSRCLNCVCRRKQIDEIENPGLQLRSAPRSIRRADPCTKHSENGYSHDGDCPTRSVTSHERRFVMRSREAMKNLAYLFTFLFVTVAFVSCGGEDGRVTGSSLADARRMSFPQWEVLRPVDDFTDQESAEVTGVGRRQVTAAD